MGRDEIRDGEEILTNPNPDESNPDPDLYRQI